MFGYFAGEAITPGVSILKGNNSNIMGTYFVLKSNIKDNADFESVHVITKIGSIHFVPRLQNWATDLCELKEYIPKLRPPFSTAPAIMESLKTVTTLKAQMDLISSQLHHIIEMRCGVWPTQVVLAMIEEIKTTEKSKGEDHL